LCDLELDLASSLHSDPESLMLDYEFSSWDESPWTIRLTEVLGSGAFATVYRCYHNQHGQAAAVKVLRKSTSGNEKNNLRSEVSSLKHLTAHHHHPGLSFPFPRLLGAYEDVEHVYVVMEEAKGCTLASIIQEKPELPFSSSPRSLRDNREACKPSTEVQAAIILRKLGEALKMLHRRGLVHRDIKPRNIILGHLGELTLVDFGLCLSLNNDSMNRISSCSTADSSVEEEREIVGSSHYIAPEALSHQHYSLAVDMWSTGVIAFVMLSGHYPFVDDEEIVASVSGPSFVGSRWEQVSLEAKDCIRLLLHHDPAKRMSVHQLRQHPWIQRWTSSLSEERSIAQPSLSEPRASPQDPQNPYLSRKEPAHSENGLEEGREAIDLPSDSNESSRTTSEWKETAMFKFLFGAPQQPAIHQSHRENPVIDLSSPDFECECDRPSLQESPLQLRRSFSAPALLHCPQISGRLATSGRSSHDSATWATEEGEEKSDSDEYKDPTTIIKMARELLLASSSDEGSYMSSELEGSWR
jgi:serine/threonine protein kinase